jgi:hypothetical protein
MLDTHKRVDRGRRTATRECWSPAGSGFGTPHHSSRSAVPARYVCPAIARRVKVTARLSPQRAWGALLWGHRSGRAQPDVASVTASVGCQCGLQR